MATYQIPTLSTNIISHWMRANIPNQNGKTVIVTGSNTGIGFWIARTFARFGARVILACRNADKAQQAVAHIRHDYPNAKCEYIQVDLACQTSIACAADKLLKRIDSLDILINNAGISSGDTHCTPDGVNNTFAVNHLGTYAFTVRLLPLILASPNARIITQTSLVYRLIGYSHETPTFSYPNSSNFYEFTRAFKHQNKAYARSKLANLLFARHLNTQLNAHGYTQRSLAAHPGLTFTNINAAAHSTTLRDFLGDIFNFSLSRLALRGANLMGMCQPFQLAGALPSVLSAVGDIHPGEFLFGPAGTMQLYGLPTAHADKHTARHAHSSQELIRVSEKLTGLSIQV